MKKIHIIYLAFAILVVAIGIIIYMAKQEDAIFLKDGIRVKATVMATHRTGKVKSPRYSMDISLFTEGEPIPTVKTDTTGKSESEKKIDAIFDKIKLKNNMGDYVTATVTINSTDYANYKAGDTLTVVYLKDNPEKVKVLAHIK